VLIEVLRSWEHRRKPIA